MSKVLIVDDEEDILDLAKIVLENAGYDVQTLSNGMHTIDLVSSFQPDLLLLDVVMPEVSGLDILRGLRRDKQTRHIKVILFTALGREVDLMLEESDKADDYILKPFNNKELVEKVKKTLKG